VKPVGGTWEPATQDTVLQEGDTIVVTGPTKQAEKFSRAMS
jgi:trk system potassium uptake protein TrkA